MNVKDFQPGIQPVGPRVLVYPLPTEEITKGGIIVLEQSREREDLCQVKALVIDVGNEAFSDCDEDWAGIGDIVLMAKYAGLYHNAKDGKKYRVINDSDIVAILTDEDTDNG